MRALIVVFSLFYGIFCVAQEPISFKGLSLGSSEAEAVKRFPKLSCSGNENKRVCSFLPNRYEEDRLRTECMRAARGAIDVEFVRACMDKAAAAVGRETVAGVNIRFMSLTFYDDLLASIQLTAPSSEFNKINTAFIDNYGSPTIDRPVPFVTRAGATFENREVEWVLPGGLIMLARLASNIDDSRVLYASKAGLDRQKSEFSDARKKAAGDL